MQLDFIWLVLDKYCWYAQAKNNLFYIMKYSMQEKDNKLRQKE